MVPYDTWQAVLAAAEDNEDSAAVAAAHASPGAIAPAHIVRRLSAGERPLRVWREHRGLSQAELAVRAKVRQATVSRIESGDRAGKVQVLHALAEALKIDIDDLLPWRE